MKIILKVLVGIMVLFGILMNIPLLFSEDINDKVYPNASNKYSITNLNVRSKANTNSDVLKVLTLQESVLVTDTIVNDFIMVLEKDSTFYGWAFSKYLQDEPLTTEQYNAALKGREVRIEKNKERQRDMELKKNPLGITQEELKKIVYSKVPYNKWEIWGDPITLEGTDNDLWVVYLPKANVSFVSRKKNDLVIFADFGKEKSIQYVKKEKRKNKTLFKNQFSSWDGSNRYLTDYIKQNMHDDDSYEHVGTVYREYSDYIIVETSFRGNNSFGAKVLQTVKAKIAANGVILEVY